MIAERVGWQRGLTVLRERVVLTMACGYSRWRDGVLIPSRSEEDLYAGWWLLLQRLDPPSTKPGAVQGGSV